MLRDRGLPLDLGHVGRLDLETEGLLLFTDDGLLLQALTNSHPVTRDGGLPAWSRKHTAADAAVGANRAGLPDVDDEGGVMKTYICELAGEPPTGDQLDKMRQPYTYGEGKGAQKQRDKKIVTKPALVQQLDAPPTDSAAHPISLVEVRITEGRNRQVRRLVQRSRLVMRTLRRVALGPLQLDIPLGSARFLTASEVADCYAAALPTQPVPVWVQALNESLVAGDASRGGDDGMCCTRVVDKASTGPDERP